MKPTASLTMSLALVLVLAGKHIGGQPACGTVVPPGLVPPNSVWTVPGSPYCISGNIQVSLLTIEPGVAVLVDGPYRIEVLSRITAVGTEAAPITFAPRNPEVSWQGFHFQNTPAGSALAYCVIDGSSAGGINLVDAAPVILDHCELRNNTSTEHGGGINTLRLKGDLVLQSCMLTSNSAAQHGGALRVHLADNHTLHIEDSVFQGNVSNPSHSNGSYVGGAIWLEQGNAVIRQSRFLENQSNSGCSSSFACGVNARGGAIFMGSGGTLEIEQGEFSGNVTDARNGGSCFFGGSSLSDGAALYVAAGDMTVRNTALAGNRNQISGAGCGPGRRGGGIFVAGGSGKVVNCTIARNPDATGLEEGGGTLEVVNSIVYNNNARPEQVGPEAPGVAITYSDIQSGYEGEGNIDLNPVFGGLGTTLDDLRIVLGSPCIDAGNPDTVYNDVCLPPSQGSARNDMGFQGGPGACRQAAPRGHLAGDCNSDGSRNISDAICLLGFLFLQKPPRLPCGDGSAADTANRKLLDHNGDDSLNIADPVALLSFLFTLGPPPALGSACTFVEGCPTTGNSCARE